MSLNGLGEVLEFPPPKMDGKVNTGLEPESKQWKLFTNVWAASERRSQTISDCSSDLTKVF